jgi:hypothetical protein
VLREGLPPHPAMVTAASAAAAATVAAAAIRDLRGPRGSGGACDDMVMELSLSSRPATVIGHTEAFTWTPREVVAT